MSVEPSLQGQYPPPQWDQPHRGAYPPPPQSALNYRGPHPPQGYGSSPSTPGDMATLPPPQHPQAHPDMYRMPPHEMYGQYPPDPRGPPPPHMGYQAQPAPRQRTAIACRYCRRRKIRCSGFDASDDGRCTNCQRFQQECIFTPVSSQAQAFVPAHTAYPHLRTNGTMPPQRGGRPLYPHQGQPAIYGAHGQPLGPPMHHDPNYPPPPPHGYPMPYPQGPVYDDRGAPPPQHAQAHPQDKVSLKRLRSSEFQPAVAAPPLPHDETSSNPYQGRRPASAGRRGSGGGYEYPDPTSIVPVSPASSVQSYQTAPYPPQSQPYSYPAPPQQQSQQAQPPPARRTSPQTSAYSYDGRASGSPHGSTSSATAAYSSYPPSGLHPPQVLPPQGEGRTPPPGNQNRETNGNNGGPRGGMAVRDLLGPGGSHEGGRSSADSSMLNALNKKM